MVSPAVQTPRSTAPEAARSPASSQRVRPSRPPEDGRTSHAKPVPPLVWTEHSESYPALTPDGLLQFSSRRPGGYGSSDLWRAARRDDGRIDEPVNMGRPVSTEHSEGDSCVSPDGGDLFFSRRVSDPRESGWAGVAGGDVYWIDARAIEALRP